MHLFGTESALEEELMVAVESLLRYAICPLVIGFSALGRNCAFDHAASAVGLTIAPAVTATVQRSNKLVTNRIHPYLPPKT